MVAVDPPPWLLLVLLRSGGTIASTPFLPFLRMLLLLLLIPQVGVEPMLSMSLLQETIVIR
jgi:hypothetical protein